VGSRGRRLVEVMPLPLALANHLAQAVLPEQVLRLPEELARVG
jgi:hypothetical protein